MTQTEQHLADSPVVTTRSGAVQGARTPAGAVFRGVPYAAPPTGALRFRAPQTVESWAGVRDATGTPPACPQPRMPRLFGNLDAGGDVFRERYDEDCLTLNIWTPTLDDGDRPVMVWFHGGWFSIGSGNEPAYDGTRLSRRGDVVVVTVNHRLGALGFLALEALDDDRVAGSANAGLLDMVAALRWLSSNIDRFGGDPGNVTIFGESGGGCKVSALLATPSAVGSFHRAVVQSGPLLRAVELDQAQDTSARLLAQLSASTLDELQALPVDAIVAAQAVVSGGPLGTLYGDGPRFAPALDGEVLPVHPFDPVAAPGGSDVPLLVGSCRDESSMVAVTAEGLDRLDAAGQAALLNDLVFRHAFDALVAGYTSTRPRATAAERLLAAAADQLRVGGIHLVERWLQGRSSPAYMYRLDFETPALGGRLGAMHALDVGFVFDNTDAAAGITSPNRGLYGDGPGIGVLADAMSEAWIAFARRGDPNHGGLPRWPTYDDARRATMVFDTASRVVDDPDGDERLLWDGVLGGM